MNNLISKTVASTLEELEVDYECRDDVFNVLVGDDYVSFTILITANEEKELLSVIGFFPVKIPKGSISKMCRMINDLNYKGVPGYFVIDPDDGELSFRNAQNVDGGAINSDIVKACLLQAFHRLRISYDDIMKAMYGGEQYSFTIGDGPCICT